MTAVNPAYRRIVRRETHSPRTVAMFVVVVLLIVGVVYAGVEIVLSLLGQPALLVSPGAALAWLIALPAFQPAPAVVAGGIVVALIGVFLIVLALAPGRLARHQMASDDRAVVIDNAVIASSLAQLISDETGTARHSVTVGVAHRVVDVTVTVDPGAALDDATVARLVDEEIAACHLTPTLRTRVKVIRPEESDDDR